MEQSRAVLLGRVLEKVISTDDISCKEGILEGRKEAIPFLCSFG